ncbi:hypothetical protein Tco_0566646 [Tanacetum coccineum]
MKVETLRGTISPDTKTRNHGVRIEAGLVYVGPWGIAVGLVNRVRPKMGKQVLVGSRVGFGTLGCRSKVSSKKVKATIPSMRRVVSQKIEGVARGSSL